MRDARYHFVIGQTCKMTGTPSTQFAIREAMRSFQIDIEMNRASSQT